MVNTGFRGKSYGWERIKIRDLETGVVQLPPGHAIATAGVDDTKKTAICTGLTSDIQPLAGMGELA